MSLLSDFVSMCKSKFHKMIIKLGWYNSNSDNYKKLHYCNKNVWFKVIFGLNEITYFYVKNLSHQHCQKGIRSPSAQIVLKYLKEISNLNFLQKLFLCLPASLSLCINHKQMNTIEFKRHHKSICTDKKAIF
jgi:hypothetical protein